MPQWASNFFQYDYIFQASEHPTFSYMTIYFKQVSSQRLESTISLPPSLLLLVTENMDVNCHTNITQIWMSIVTQISHKYECQCHTNIIQISYKYECQLSQNLATWANSLSQSTCAHWSSLNNFWLEMIIQRWGLWRYDYDYDYDVMRGSHVGAQGIEGP